MGRIRDALDNDRFVLYAQPIVDLASREVVQHELLIRMMNADGEVIVPDNFLPAAEEYGLITEIDRWVMHETARLAALGHAVEFNLSAKSVADPGMLALIASAIEEYGANRQPTSSVRSPKRRSCATSGRRTVRARPQRPRHQGCARRLRCRYGGFAY